MNRTAALCLALALVALLLRATPSHSQDRAAPPPGLPVGAIVAWHPPGKAARPPAGWQLCDGSRIRDPRFTRRFGADRFTPNLNGAAEPESKHNPGHQTYLRGGQRSPADGYGGSNVATPHTHRLAHTHRLSHSHRLSLRTTRSGSFGGGAKAGGTRTTSGRHGHDVRGRTEAASGATDTPSALRTGAERVAVEPRHFDVVYIMKIY